MRPHSATPRQVERCLDRLLGEGEAPVRLLRALAIHVTRLHGLALRIEAGEGIDQVIERARPPIHFRRKASVRAALGRWPAARSAAALGRLVEAEVGCKTTGSPAAALCRRTVLAICLGARAGAGQPRPDPERRPRRQSPSCIAGQGL